MSDTGRDPHPDSMPGDNHDGRSDIEQAVSGTNRDITNVTEADGETPLEPTGVADGVGGTGGVTRNQDDNAQ
ncbi:hypothetical protein [Sphingomonas baiyangensis]|uniref:Uncharacterized protein n=1 Tax=Sphingomonas baiyangensis TaxID=2572576 RepID=A0A4U1L058_9SPHN|nr:hypothetical protein [Sphingomonas baiyangensis]TKD50087.1 hypothetical protein FBR43_04430 [Sphingomonas baiyangensis]